jgi:hypothetical protein
MPIPNNTLPGNSAPSRLAIVPRVLLITFILTGLTFAVSLLFGILGMAGIGVLRGHLPDMRMAYRHFAFPVAMTVGGCAFIAAWVMEIRHYRQKKSETGMARHA